MTLTVVRRNAAICKVDPVPNESVAATAGSKVPKLRSLDQLPAAWWKKRPNEEPGYQMVTEVCILGRGMRTLLDYGAAVNAITEEAVVGIRSEARARGMQPSDPNFPVVQLENGTRKSP